VNLKNIIRPVLIILVGYFVFLQGTESLYTPIPAEINNARNCKISLNGIWQFKSYQIKKEPNKISGWKGIKVPGEWVMQGYEVEENEFATYYNKFKIPKDWQNKIIILRFDAVYSHAVVKINKKHIGEHEGGFTAFEFDITEKIKYNNQNEIVVYVKNESLADTLVSGTQYAAHQLGGIIRKVSLFAVPKFHLSDLFYTIDFDNQYKNAVLNLQFELSNYSSRDIDGRLRISLYAPDGNLVKVKKHKIGELQSNSSLKRNYKIEVKNPAKWDSEHPRLYTLECELVGGEDRVTIKEKVGFREIEIVGNKIFINGNPIKLKGVNRHEVHPLLGRSLTDRYWLKDAELFQGANMNFIRTAHYPSAREFVSICDSIGLFVELEAPFAWIGHHANKKWRDSDPHAPQYYNLIKQQLNQTIQFYKNNPSVIIWSMANESAWGSNWKKAFKFVDELDPSRPKTFHDQAYGGFNNYGSDTMQIANIHYPGPGGPEMAENFKRPLLFGEFCHINTYNRQELETDPGVRDFWGIELKNIWEDMYYSRGCLGGAIWSGINDVFYLAPDNAVGYGQWGVIDGWRRKKPEYWHCKKVFSPVKIHNNRIDRPFRDNQINLQVENRYNFTNLNEVTFKWEYQNESGSLSGPDLLPGEFGIIKIDPGKTDLAKGRLSVSVFDRNEQMVDKYNIKIGKSNRTIANCASDGLIEYKDNGHALIISTDSSEWKIDKTNGKILNSQILDKQFITAGPELMMLPLKTGPCDTEHRLNIEPFNDICSNWQLKDIQIDKNNDTIKIGIKGSYDEGQLNMDYNFIPQSILQVDYEIELSQKIDPRQIGLVFTLSKGYDNSKWERKGLWSAYPEKHIGRNKGTAQPFYHRSNNSHNVTKQNRFWSYDYNELGSNDFRSTKNNIYYASLTNDSNEGVKVLSQGKHGFRAFVNGDKISFLVADFSIGGGELFLGSHLAPMKKKLKVGDKFEGSIKLQIVK